MRLRSPPFAQRVINTPMNYALEMERDSPALKAAKWHLRGDEAREEEDALRVNGENRRADGRTAARKSTGKREKSKVPARKDRGRPLLGNRRRDR